MQNLKNLVRKSDGITLAVLVLTIIVLLIVLSISLNYGTDTLLEATDGRTEGELSFVQQAVAQQYFLLITKNEDGQIATAISEDTDLSSDTDRPDTLIGTRIANVSTLESYGFSSYLIDYESSASDLLYEEYYYSLDESDLETIGIEKGNSSEDNTTTRAYIVNYSTGEVFDIANKTYYETSESIYTEGTDTVVNQTTYDFSDE